MQLFDEHYISTNFMKNLSSDSANVKPQSLLSDYQAQLSQSLTEIKNVITLLKTQEEVINDEEKLSETITVANHLVDQVSQKLQLLRKQSLLLQCQDKLSELENTVEIQDITAHKLDKITPPTKQWGYIA